MSAAPLPPGYSRGAVGSTQLVARDWARHALTTALESHGSLFRWAEAQRGADPLQGRGVAWGTELPAGADGAPTTPVVVRHSRHGGIFAPLTGDRFLRPTRAPAELAAATRLASSGVPTAEIIAYAVHPVAGLWARSDVMTRRLPAGHDFPVAWRRDDSASARTAMLEAVASLLRGLSAAGAHHPDLNVKNVYLAGAGASYTAYVLDVDRVRFTADALAAARNFARFARSVRKWDAEQSLGVGDDALVRLAALAWVDS